MAATMEYNYLGSSGVKVSNLCLGTLTFGTTDKAFVEFFQSGRQADQELANKMMDRFVELGGNFIDTANLYALGEAEEMVGYWMKSQRREKIIIASKARYQTKLDDMNYVGLSRRHLIEACEDSLRRLQTDYIDLYQIVSISLLLWVCALTCEGGYIKKRPSGCYYSRRQCEAKCCSSEKKCEATEFRGRTYYKCVTVDCGSLSDPANGYVAHLGGTTFESQAEYRCNDGYHHSYPALRTCLSSGLWSATAPTCDPEPICKEKECPMLDPPCNGLILDAPTNPKPGDVATYECQVGFGLEGEKTRTCLEDYTWDGISPCCIRRPCLNMTEYGDGFEGSTYNYVANYASWADAKSLCEEDSAYLLEVNSEAEQIYLESLLPAGDVKWWTNANDMSNSGEWIWSLGGGNFSVGSTEVYNNWRAGEPIQSAGCMNLHGLDYEWEVNDCSMTFCFVCEC